MSWKDEVMNVVSEMLAEVDDLKDEPSATYTRSTLKGYARTLKAICGSVPDTPTPATTPIGSFPFLGGMNAELQNHMMIQEARKEFAGKVKPQGMVEESHDGESVLCMGGPADNSYTSIHPNMPYGTLQEVSGGMYQLRFDAEKQTKSLIFHEKKTEELQAMVRNRKTGD